MADRPLVDLLAELGSLDAKATPAPWLWVPTETENPQAGEHDDEICWIDRGIHGPEPFTFGNAPIVQTDGGVYGPRDPDGALIVALRNAAGPLLATARVARLLAEATSGAWDVLLEIPGHAMLCHRLHLALAEARRLGLLP